MGLGRILVANLIVASRRIQATEMLSRLLDHQLRDIGLERDDIPGHVAATMPWPSRETPRVSHGAMPSLQGLG